LRRAVQAGRISDVSNPETIGERLRRLREERGLTQRDLVAPGVSAQYVSKLERGQRNASVKALRQLAKNLGVSWQYLENGHDLADSEVRDFKLDDAELALRLGDEPSAVEATLRALLDEAVIAGDPRAATRARLALGVLAAHRGGHADAISALEQAIAEPWVTPFTDPDTYVTLGHSYVAVGRGDAAAALFRSCLDKIRARRPLNGRAVTRFATYLSYVLVDLESFDEAREALELALRHAASSDDPYTAVRVYWSSARLAATAGELDAAQADINRAIGLLEATEDTAHLARAHLLAAEIALWDESLSDAAEHLDAAERLQPRGADVEDRGFLLVQKAFLAARAGEAAEAIDYANAALALLPARDDPTIRGRAHWALGEAFAAAGAGASARAAFTEASELIPPGSTHAARLLDAWQRAVPAETP
jgi:transcriptional regulator with XRE-family HTH domain